MTNKKLFKTIMIICLGLVVVSCLFLEGCIPTEKYERTVQLTESLEPGKEFATLTHNGTITVTGADITQCDITATIIGKANTVEDAQKIAEQVEIKFHRSGDKLTAKIEKPTLIDNKYVTVNLVVAVPGHTSLDLITHNGEVRIDNITGRTKAQTHNGAVSARSITGETILATHNGRVSCQQVTGNMQLLTHNGEISCKEVSGDVQLTTHNGGIQVAYSNNASGAINAKMETHNGGIELKSPSGLSAKLDASTHNGSIHTDVPVTIVGKLNKKNIKGTIGDGQGSLYLKTHNGSINIK